MSLFTKKIVGIEFHDYIAQLTEIKLSGNKLFLQSYNRIILPPDVIENGKIKREDALKEAIISLLQNANPKPVEAKEIAIIFPSNQVFNHIFSFPLTFDEAEIRKAIPYEVETVMPFSIEDIYWDFTVLERETSGKKHASQHVLFSAITKETADQYTSLFEAIGLTPFLFGVHAEAMKYGALRQLPQNGNSFIIDFNTLAVNFMTVKNAGIRNFFSSPQGGKSLLESLKKEFDIDEISLLKEKESGGLNAKFSPIIEGFINHNYKTAQSIIADEERKDGMGPITNILLTGDFLNVTDSYTMALKAFPDKSIIVGDPRKYLIIDPQKFTPIDKDDQKLSKYYFAYFNNAAGIGIRGLTTKVEQGINLLPDKLRQNSSSKKRTIFLAMIAIAMSVMSLAIATTVLMKHQEFVYQRLNLEIKKSSVDQVIYGTRYKEIRELINTFNTEVAELSAIDNALFSVARVTSDIYDLVPQGISVTALKFNDEELSLEVIGVAENRDVLLETHQLFQTAEFVDEVITPVSNYDRSTQIPFSITLKLLFKKLPKYGA